MPTEQVFCYHCCRVQQCDSHREYDCWVWTCTVCGNVADEDWIDEDWWGDE